MSIGGKWRYYTNSMVNTLRHLGKGISSAVAGVDDIESCSILTAEHFESHVAGRFGDSVKSPTVE